MYTVQAFDGPSDVVSDIIEQKHFNKDGTLFSDYEMVINSPNILPDQIALVKVIFTPGKEPEKPVLAQQEASKMSLDIEGFTNEGHVLFKYSNVDQ